jgi:hypothetical protein
MSDSNIENLPESDARDRLHRLVTTLVSPIPYAEEIITAIVKPPLDKRREDWLIELATAVVELQRQHEQLTAEYLSQHPVFITAVMEATTIAVRTHREDHLSYLRNMVLNAALPEAPDDDTQKMFFRMADEFTSWHITILEFFKQSNWYVTMGYELPMKGFPDDAVQKLVEIFPQLNGKHTFTNRIVNDLIDWRLLSIDNLSLSHADTVIVVRHNFDPEIVTDLGREFLGFIHSPISEQG